LEPTEEKIARQICELLGVPYPSEDARQMRRIILKEMDYLIAENKKLRMLKNSVDGALNSGNGSFKP